MSINKKILAVRKLQSKIQTKTKGAALKRFKKPKKLKEPKLKGFSLGIKKPKRK